MSDKATLYRTMSLQLGSLMEGCRMALPTLANCAALMWMSMPEINWAGFYLMKKGQLVLGPFQGRPACIEIALSRGVCGAAAREDRVQRVADVHLFPGHIACDSASASEIVIPLHLNGKIIGVLDIDSPETNRFTEADEQGLQLLADVLEKHFAQMEDWPC